MLINDTDQLEYEINYKWMDITGPTEAELEKIAIDYSINKDLVLNCLSSAHIPHLKEENGYYFIVLRAFDQSAKKGEVLQAYTNKIVLFFNANFLISIHRIASPYLNTFIESINQNKDFFKKNSTFDIVLKIFKIVILSFEIPLHNNEFAMDSIEGNKFPNRSPVGIFNDIHYIKRSTSIVKRTLWKTDAIIQDLYEIIPEYKDKLNSIKEGSNRLQYLAEEIEFTAQNILSLHISIASHRTSEVMRTLAIFSVFFMPLTFIAGIYGMNFTIMPELQWKYGYPAVLAFMVLICIFLYFWFKKKGWYRSTRN